LNKTHGKTVGEVMTPSPLVVQETTNLEDAAKVLLDSKFRRLPVVDEKGRLIGLLTRGNVVRAALEMKRAAMKADGN
jgi:CBS domain-containing protein